MIDLPLTSSAGDFNFIVHRCQLPGHRIGSNPLQFKTVSWFLVQMQEHLEKMAELSERMLEKHNCDRSVHMIVKLNHGA